jgi:lincosamide nucleotidyltransferase A/C/D/E
VLAALTALGCRFWLEGGWGVDALVGHQTRPHRDLDVDLDARSEEPALAVLAEMGYTVETDWRPNRIELHAPGRGRVDLHPLLIDENGSARQAALHGGSTSSRGGSSSPARLLAFRFHASPSPRSVSSAPGTSYEL